MATGRVPTTANSPLTAKGDLFTYSTAPARLAVGNDGETIVADSSTSTGLRYTAGNPVPNPILNSAFQVWQRGTSFTTTSTYTADRWYKNSNANQTISRQATNDTTNLPFIQYCARVQRNSGATTTSTLGINQSFENINSTYFAGKTLTVSFYARAGANFSSGSNNLITVLYGGTGTDQNVSVAWTGTTQTVNATNALTTTWQRFTATGTMSATATQMAIEFYCNPTGTAGANDYFEVTGVQIDVGSVALAYRPYAGTIQGELAACQRYYYLVASGATVPLGVGWCDTTTQGGVLTQFPVSMRTTPSIVQTTGSSYYVVNTANSSKTFNSFVGINIATPNMVVYYGTISGGTAGQSGYSFTNNAAASIAFSAEL